MASNFPDNRNEYHLEKPLPSSEATEAVVLGSIILDNSLIDQTIGKISPESFYNPLYRRIFAAMLALHHRNSPIDPILIGEELKKEGSLESIGGVTRITGLVHGLPHFPNIGEYVDVVAEKATRRNLIRLCGSISSEAQDEDEGVEIVMDRLEQGVFSLRTVDAKQDFSTIAQLGGESLEVVKQKAKSGEDVVLGIPSGFRDIDEMTSGFQSGDLIICAGRPSMGKTSLALDISLNATAYNPEAVIAIFELEMSKRQLGDRMICQQSRIDSTRYKRGHLLGGDWDRLTVGLSELHSKRIHIVDTPRLSAMDIRARSRKLKKKEGRLDMIIVDHLGLMKGSGRKEKHIELGEISKELKAMAKDLDVPVLALCQLSRGPETRPDNKPKMSDLRQSGEIEEDADTVMLVYRADYYKETIDNAGKAEIMLVKNRNGPTGTISLAFQKQWTHFADLHEE